jgi:endonuclease IV
MPLGIHVAKVSHVLTGSAKTRKTMVDAIHVDCSELKLNSCQIFVQGPRNSHMNNMDYGKIKKYCTEKKINLYVHSSYITVGIFSITEDNASDSKSTNAIKAIVAQLKACDELGSLGLVVHISKKSPKQIVESFKVLEPFTKKYNTPILLEMPAKRPDGNLTYETPQKINNLTKLMKKDLPKFKFGWCIDTAHIFAAGVEIDIYKILKEWLNNLQYPQMIDLFHINGLSIKLFDTGKDTHEIPFSADDGIFGDDVIDDDGYVVFDIKKIKKTSMGLLSKFSKKYGVDAILEINKGSFQDAKFAIDNMRDMF